MEGVTNVLIIMRLQRRSVTGGRKCRLVTEWDLPVGNNSRRIETAGGGPHPAFASGRKGTGNLE